MIFTIEKTSNIYGQDPKQLYKKFPLLKKFAVFGEDDNRIRIDTLRDLCKIIDYCREKIGNNFRGILVQRCGMKDFKIELYDAYRE